jgi:hypothetical protein
MSQLADKVHSRYTPEAAEEIAWRTAEEIAEIVIRVDRDARKDYPESFNDDEVSALSDEEVRQGIADLSQTLMGILWEHGLVDELDVED